MSRKLEWVRGASVILCMLLMVVLTAQVARGEDNPVVARIGDTVITLSQFKNQVNQTLSAKDRLSAQRFYDVLDDMITGILFSKEAVEDGLDKTQETMAAIKGVSEDKRVEILANAYKNKSLAPSKVTEKEAAEYYSNNLNLYNTPNIYSGIMFNVMKKDATDTDNDCTQTCKDVLQELYNRLSAKDYETVVKLKDELSEKYPDINILFILLSHWEGKVKGSIYDNALKEFMQLKPGQVKIIQEKDFHIVINLTGIYEPPVYKFEELKNRVIADLERKDSQKKYNEAIKKLAEKYKLQVYPQYIEQLANEQRNNLTAPDGRKSEGKPHE
ncbi:MAG: hypothetical protein HQL03_04510 [Nitrospirae bacterium]|nr:hypothetical protein [Nitrospirota bacterium]MBF0590748.1 hypothetical protein [Nitrospirota bacterium]